MRYAIVIAVIVIMAGGYLFLAENRPEQEETTGSVAVQPIQKEISQALGDVENVRPSGQQAARTEEDRLYEEKQATYKKLEKARRDLDRRLARMKMSLWNVKLPKEEADSITQQLMSAYKLINNPKLMGAYKDLDEISRDLTQVEYAKAKVKELRLQVEAQKDADG